MKIGPVDHGIHTPKQQVSHVKEAAEKGPDNDGDADDVKKAASVTPAADNASGSNATGRIDKKV